VIRILFATIGLFSAIFPAFAQNAAVRVAPSGQEMKLVAGKAEVIDIARPAGEILVSNPAVVDVSMPSATRVYLLAKGVGDANIFVFDSAGGVITRLDVHVRVDENTLRTTMRSMLPNEQIQAETINKDVVLRGKASSPAVADRARQIARRFVADDKNLVDMMTVQGEQQVLLKVQIVETETNRLRELGIETGFGPENIGAVLLGLVPTAGAGLTTTPFASGTLLHSPNGSNQLNLAIRALERDGLIRTLAEPNLTAVSGETASFLAGGEFPIPIAQGDDGRITIEFKKFGVSLAFTPTVLDKSRIALKLGTEVSALSTEGQIQLRDITIPAISVRRAETSVEMASGGTLMIAGLLQSNIVDTVTGLPGLKSIPVLGKLFQSQSFNRRESELVVLITPILVKPMNEPMAARLDQTPGQAPVDLGLMDGLRRRYGQSAAVDRPKPAGSVGYLID
jgi:pilus assembly protein CpaC